MKLYLNTLSIVLIIFSVSSFVELKNFMDKQKLKQLSPNEFYLTSIVKNLIF
jgi:hypothetical protein